MGSLHKFSSAVVATAVTLIAFAPQLSQAVAPAKTTKSTKASAKGASKSKRKPTTTVSKPKPLQLASTDASPTSFWLGATSRRRADQLISVFENSTTEIQYGYVENLGDGRGLTAGRAGFTTATCDALDVVLQYGDKGSVSFAQFTGELQRLCDDHSDETAALPEAEFASRWRQAAADPAFRAAQDHVVDELYYSPAMRIADKLDLQTVASRVELFDAAIQHGVGKDHDGLPALVKRTNETVERDHPGVLLEGRIVRGNEKVWLNTFLDVRNQDLLNPDNGDTAKDWANSTDRVDCIRAQVATNNVSLNGPFTCEVYGSVFTIK
jgi:chitosanase